VDRVPAEDRQALLDAMSSVLLGGAEAGLEHRLLTSQGRVVWLQTRVRAGRRAPGDGAQPELQGLSVDVTALKESEARLRRSKERSDFLAEASLSLSQTLDQGLALQRVAQLAVPRIADWLALDLVGSDGTLRSACLH